MLYNIKFVITCDVITCYVMLYNMCHVMLYKIKYVITCVMLCYIT